MKKKIYFAGSISGGRKDAELYNRIIKMMQETDIVLTEHIGKIDYSTANRTLADEQAVYNQDTAWLLESNLVIAECSQPSLGVGYEMAYAEAHNKPVYIFHKVPSDIHFSAMLSGNPYFHVYSYETEEEMLQRIKQILCDESEEIA